MVVVQVSKQKGYCNLWTISPMLMQSGESPKMNTSVPSMSGPAKPKDSSAPHLPFAVLKVKESVGLDRTWRKILIGMPD